MCECSDRLLAGECVKVIHFFSLTRSIDRSIVRSFVRHATTVGCASSFLPLDFASDARRRISPADRQSLSAIAHTSVQRRGDLLFRSAETIDELIENSYSTDADQRLFFCVVVRVFDVFLDGRWCRLSDSIATNSTLDSNESAEQTARSTKIFPSSMDESSLHLRDRRNDLRSFDSHCFCHLFCWDQRIFQSLSLIVFVRLCKRKLLPLSFQFATEGQTADSGRQMSAMQPPDLRLVSVVAERSTLQRFSSVLQVFELSVVRLAFSSVYRHWSTDYRICLLDLPIM